MNNEEKLKDIKRRLENNQTVTKDEKEYFTINSKPRGENEVIAPIDEYVYYIENPIFIRDFTVADEKTKECNSCQTCDNVDCDNNKKLKTIIDVHNSKPFNQFYPHNKEPENNSKFGMTVDEDINKIYQMSSKKEEDKTNPKQLVGASNIPMSSVSPLFKAMTALGKMNGALKYRNQ